jgi:hypothetical protein
VLSHMRRRIHVCHMAYRMRLQPSLAVWCERMREKVHGCVFVCVCECASVRVCECLSLWVPVSVGVCLSVKGC